MGRPEEAIRNCEADINANGRDPATLAVLAVACAAAGRRSEVEQILAELTRLSQKQYVPKTFLADIYTALGERDGAFRMLNQAYFEHDINLMMIRTNQLLTPLQADSRFQKILDHLASVNQSVRNAAPGMVHPAIKTPESLRNAAIN
jgi:tetratricopeptide (TPR) repeat protein